MPSLGMPKPVSREGEHINSLWQGFVIAGFVVFGIVVGLILYAAIRFRRRDDEVPSQRAYNIPIEVLYTVVPVVVVAALFGFSVATQLKVTNVARRDRAMVVNVTGFQWGWRFDFPDQHVVVQGPGESDHPPIDVPVGQPVRFVLRTDGREPLVLGSRTSSRNATSSRASTTCSTSRRRVTGTYGGRCAEFCGLDHWRMPFTLHVVPPDDFDRGSAASRGGRPMTVVDERPARRRRAARARCRRRRACSAS